MLRSLSTGSGRGCHLHVAYRETESQGGAVTACPAEDSSKHYGYPRDPALPQPRPLNKHHFSQPDGKGEAQDAVFLCPFNSYVELPYPYTLQEVQVGIINTTMCNYLYSQPYFRQTIWGDMVCAGDPKGDKDACFVSVLPTPTRTSGS